MIPPQKSLETMVRRTKEEAQATRQSILDAAVCAFYKKGVAQATMEDIAESAGVTRGAVYWHFKNKQEIVGALHDEIHQPLSAILMEELAAAHPDPLKQLEKLYIRILKQIVTDEAKHRILSVFTTKCDYTGDLECFLERQTCQKQEAMNMITDRFEYAETQGLLRPGADPKLIALSSVCYISGICNEYLRHPDMFNMEQDGPALIAQYFRGLRV